MTWDKLDRLTEPTRLWSLLVGVAAVFAFRFAFDATDADAVGWGSFALLWVLILALTVLCIARVILLIRNSQQAWHAGWHHVEAISRWLRAACGGSALWRAGAPCHRYQGATPDLWPPRLR